MATIFCPRARHPLRWTGAIFDTDLIPCVKCGPDEFIRVGLTMETVPDEEKSLPPGDEPE